MFQVETKKITFEDLKNTLSMFSAEDFRRININYLKAVALSRLYMLPEARLIHTLSNFHCLLYEVYPTSRHSSQEHAMGSGQGPVVGAGGGGGGGGGMMVWGWAWCFWCFAVVRGPMWCMRATFPDTNELAYYF